MARISGVRFSHRMRPWALPLVVCGMISICIYDLQQINTTLDQVGRSSTPVRMALCPDGMHPDRQETRSISGKELHTGDPYNPGLCNSECERKRDLKRQVNCLGLMEAEKEARHKAKLYLNYHPKLAVRDQDVTTYSDCVSYRENVFYPSTPLSQEEAEYPIAFSVVAHKDVYQLERLLQAIYWPQNFYCIHIDNKASPVIVNRVDIMEQCLPNVFTPTRRESVIYGHMSRLQADLNCMDELLRYNKTWKYVINLTGQEYPLRTNREIMKILKIYNGANDVEGLSKGVTTSLRSRYASRWELTKTKPIQLRKVKDSIKGPPPGNITLVKGSAFGVFSRAFIEFIFSDKLVQEFLLWLNDTWSPDELFWSTLNTKLYNPMLHSPGGYDAVPERKPWLAKYSAWPPRDECHGTVVRGVCIFSYLDLPNLISQRHLFANKFHVDSDYLVLDCLEEWIHNKTFHTGLLPMEYSVYLNSPIVTKVQKN